MTAVLIYTRLSTEDVHDATVRQEVACRSYAEARNWDVAGALGDLDASAYQPRVRRPGFESLIADAAARSADGVLVWKLDRLVRRPKDSERLWEVAERRGVFIASVPEPVDSSSPIGLAMLRILVALAGLESATTGVRVRASKRQAAEEGKPPPVKAYGLTMQWDGIIETEACVLREAAHRAIAGERLASVARDLRSRGIPSPSGRQWTDATLGRLLRNPRLVGDRAYRGQVVARDCWPAILERDTFTRLQLTLNHPARQGAPPRHHKRLATGFAHCGLCGQSMSTTTRSGVRYYSCPTQPTAVDASMYTPTASKPGSWISSSTSFASSHRQRPRTPTLATSRRRWLSCAATTTSIASFPALRSCRPERCSCAAPTSSRRSGRRPETARVLAAANPRKQLGALEVGQLRDLLADRLDRLVVNPMIKPATWRVRRSPAPMRMEDTGTTSTVVANDELGVLVSVEGATSSTAA
jgi:DNA invertase Pin-like site-specific DNA recombinase